jgi:hypothetical protein
VRDGTVVSEYYMALLLQNGSADQQSLSSPTSHFRSPSGRAVRGLFWYGTPATVLRGPASIEQLRRVGVPRALSCVAQLAPAQTAAITFGCGRTRYAGVARQRTVWSNGRR